jgi:3-hydroxybutyrate dehydrogenase
MMQAGHRQALNRLYFCGSHASFSPDFGVMMSKPSFYRALRLKSYRSVARSDFSRSSPPIQPFFIQEDTMTSKSLGGKNLSGKTALVTGSTSGIGLGIARSLAAEGANVLLNGFGDAAEIDKLQADLASEFAVKVAYHNADMSKPADIADMMAYADATFGGVDVLVNNAGIQHVDSVEDFPVEKWDAIIAINLTSAFHTSRLALPGMRAKNWGRIINLASAHGLVGSAGKSAYVAAKHGLVGLTKVAALETATTGVTVNAICPGFVLTPLVQKQVDARAARDGISNDDAKKALLADKQPSGDFVTPEELGALAVFLCGDAAKQVRGVAWNMDGGWVAQ